GRQGRPLLLEKKDGALHGCQHPVAPRDLDRERTFRRRKRGLYRRRRTENGTVRGGPRRDPLTGRDRRPSCASSGQVAPIPPGQGVLPARLLQAPPLRRPDYRRYEQESREI